MYSDREIRNLATRAQRERAAENARLAREEAKLCAELEKELDEEEAAAAAPVDEGDDTSRRLTSLEREKAAERALASRLPGSNDDPRWAPYAGMRAMKKGDIAHERRRRRRDQEEADAGIPRMVEVWERRKAEIEKARSAALIEAEERYSAARREVQKQYEAALEALAEKPTLENVKVAA